jgi:ATP-dependent Clp protease adaptor protein ClpS
MPSTLPVLDPSVDSNLDFQSSQEGRWQVLIFNNETNTWQEVVEVLMQATGCDTDEAVMETWEAHTYGKAPVHFAAKTECNEIARIISIIGVQTSVCPEWAD